MKKKLTLILVNTIFVSLSVYCQIKETFLTIPERKANAEGGSEFMHRIKSLPLSEREEEIYKVLSSGNLPDFLRKPVILKGSFKDALGEEHEVIYQAMPDYLAVGSNEDYCRIPMNPHTAQKLADLFGGSLITAKISDHLYENATIKLSPFFYKPVGNQNESVEKFVDHNNQIELQKKEAGGQNGQLIAGIKKDIILSHQLSDLSNKVIIYGWHQLDGKPIQPVYAGHVDWYVDYSHGIRLISQLVKVDGKEIPISRILSDPILFKLISDEEEPVLQTRYLEKNSQQ
ncbi:hypothetical protein OU792_09840 [Algoriphagus sp. NF]|uniref:hypothetical protein n=3 Tax=Algoriphagus TaxID=246875 RepID=UPI0010660245|nr:hypothetical protein [Algoriphagus sp. NF]MDE0560286.1 hypothetical protein [Algoriphagus sp. NF]